jgi:hypothetical protein
MKIEMTPFMAGLTPAQLKKFKAGVEKVVKAKPSQLIKIALKDLAKAEKSPRYVIKMEHWHTLLSNGKCAVCLAGSVIAGTACVPHSMYVSEPNEIDGLEFSDRMDALNCLRSGGLREFLYDCGVPWEKADAWVDDHADMMDTIPQNYTARSRKKFRKALFAIADSLEKAGL